MTGNRRPENDDGRFRVVLWGAVVQRGEGQWGCVQRLRCGSIIIAGRFIHSMFCYNAFKAH